MEIIKKKAKKESKSRIMELLDFLLHPNINLSTAQSLKQTLKDVLFYLFFSWLLGVVIIAITYSLISVENTAYTDIKDKYSFIQTLFIVSILVPVMEELFFRLPLKFKPSYLGIAIGILFWVIFGKINTLFGNKASVVYQILCFLSAVPIGVLTFYFAKKHSEKLLKFWQNNFRFIFYTSVLLFGLAHAPNFALTIENIVYLPLIVFPWFIAGHCIGFVRIKYGFVFALLTHVLNNVILVLFNL